MYIIPSFLVFLYCVLTVHLLTGALCSHVFPPSCCVCRPLHGGQTSWWSMQRPSWPSMPSTWMPLWRSSPLRAGTASPSSSFSMTSSGLTVSSQIILDTYFYVCTKRLMTLFSLVVHRSSVQWKVPQTPSGSVCSSGG